MPGGAGGIKIKRGDSGGDDALETGRGMSPAVEAAVELIDMGGLGVLGVTTQVGCRNLNSFETRVETACSQRLKLNHDRLLSSFAFNSNLRQYTWGSAAETARAAAVSLSKEGDYTRPLFGWTRALFVGYVGCIGWFK